MVDATGPQVMTTVGWDGRLPKKRARVTYKRIREVRLDPTVRLARQLIIAPVLAAPWSFESKKAAPVGAADFVKEQFEPLRLHLLITATLGCIDFGWQGYEKVFEQTAAGATGIKRLKPLLQDLTDVLVYQDTGAFAGLYQSPTGNRTEPVELDVASSLLVSQDVEGTDWYGQASMEVAALACNKWDDVDRAADEFDRKVAGSHWVVHYPADRSSVYDGKEYDNYEIALKILAALKASGGVVVPSDIDGFTKDNPGWKIELLEAAMQQTGFIARQAYIDKLKVRALGLPERSVLEGEFGTKAEAAVHADLAITNMELRHLILVQQVNWHCVNQLLRLNFGPSAENTVFIQPAPLTDVQRAWLQDLYKTILADPSGFAMEYGQVDMEAIREKLGLPEKETAQ